MTLEKADLRKGGAISDQGERLAMSIASGSIGIASAGSPVEPGDKKLLLAALDAQRSEIARLRDGDSIRRRRNT